jgi:hypothetical protein
MTRKELIDAVEAMSQKKRTQWLIALGWQMTISARAAGYPVGEKAGNIAYLVAFNEMQHQLFNYLRHSQTDHGWPIVDFLDSLFKKAATSGVEGHFGAAVTSSLKATR